MNQKMGRMIRHLLIIKKLSGRKKFTPAEELISYLNLQMELLGYEVGLSLRSLQRDIGDIESLFEIEIKNPDPEMTLQGHFSYYFPVW